MMVDTVPKPNLKAHLKEVFGYNQFRGNQEPVIQNVLNRQNTFVIMPTGAGKSLCYQLPAVMMPGITLVISPLIALMKNQVNQLNAAGVKAYFLNSTLSKTESNRIKKEILEGEVKLVLCGSRVVRQRRNVIFFRKPASPL